MFIDLFLSVFIRFHLWTNIPPSDRHARLYSRFRSELRIGHRNVKLFIGILKLIKLPVKPANAEKFVVRTAFAKLAVM